MSKTPLEPAPDTGADPSPATEGDTPADRFVARCAAGLESGRFQSLLLSKHRGPEPDLQRVGVRPVVVRRVPCLSFVYRYATRDVTKNLPLADAWPALRALLGPVFRQGHLQLTDEAVELSISQRGVCTLRSTRTAGGGHAPPDEPSGGADGGPADSTQVGVHDRAKTRWVDVSRPFLVELGVTTPGHSVVPAMSRKWKQINRFVEVFAGALRAARLLDFAPHVPLERRPLRVVDFGSGKGYLTFAVHDYLCQQPGIDPQVVGVELRPDMVGLGNAAARRLGLEGLRFEEGDVRTRESQPIDVMIALHACDTATDHAIHLGVRGGAAVILCSPCCHKQLRPQLLSPHPLAPILQHGVHLGQQAEMLTDGLRALLLEACGYETQVFEFVSLEHTQKNKMILAVRRPSAAAPTAVWTQIEDLKSFYGIRDHCLETLLRAHGLRPNEPALT